MRKSIRMLEVSQVTKVIILMMEQICHFKIISSIFSIFQFFQNKDIFKSGEIFIIQAIKELIKYGILRKVLQKIAL